MSLAKPLVVTAGEPAGVGPELCNALLDSPYADDLIVIGDRRQLNERLTVIDTPFPADVVAGKPDPANAETLLNGLRAAATGCLAGDYVGMVTAPLAKHVIADSGVAFTGHTEFLAEVTNAPHPVMLLAAGDLRVALASTHLPLRDVPDYISQDGIENVLTVLLEGLRTRFGLAEPRVAVCGLNPHAGEGGHLGSEDANVIAPAIQTVRSKGHDVRGPYPADTVFTPAAGRHDAVLAMFHDQGLPVIKYAGFGNAVNVTLGLPIIRTSVDHGTALDIAGQGKADAGSLLAAVELAVSLANQ